MMRCFLCCMGAPSSGGGGNDDEAGPSQPGGNDDEAGPSQPAAPDVAAELARSAAMLGLGWEADGEGTNTFGLEQLRVATDNFHMRNYLGEGGFDTVYKGYLQPDRPVAIKQLDQQGRQGHREFVEEILMLAILKHPNLVKLYGYCADGNERLLVYEFMAEGSLESHLFDVGPGRQPLEWNTRVKIATDAAKGLVYLHDIADPRVIHRDIKSANILLDDEFNAKLSDFGLAKIGPVGDQTHVTTRIVGTHGYVAPEYATTGRLTFMSDVYSFGVTLLELITGQRANDESSTEGENTLVVRMMPFEHDARRYPELADPLLQDRYPVQGFRRLMQLAWSCLWEDATARPRMRQLLHGLEGVASHPYTEPTVEGAGHDAPSTSGAS